MDTISLTPWKIDGEGVLPQRSATDGESIGHDDPAVLAITDFTREAPITVEDERPIDTALEDMARFGVRALLVVRERRIVGMITSYDIQGERPLQFLQNSNYNHHRDIRVGHIMTSWSELLALRWSDVQAARAGDLLELLRHAGLTHLLVVERRADRKVVVRGLASRARLERQLRAQGPGMVPQSLSAQTGS
ncbi:MAG TPA: CBS domain-containing protein [Steroidobacteraceae bacterium]|nr:CBS domain-containing protein [Steroidobacteraceae bacterium]